MTMRGSGGVLPRRAAVIVFLAFAFAYFLSALVRAVTATLAPTLAQEFSLHARDLGLLAGGYFLGFSATQLPLGTWLDRHGPKKVALGFLGVAVVGSLVFSAATGFSGLLAGRVLCGAGVSACLMAPLTGYRRWLEPVAQMRANSWMLMTGSLGMVASTLPVQWALPLVGWRPLFWGLAVLIALSMVVIALWVPGWGPARQAQAESGAAEAVPQGYGVVWRHPYFQRLAPLGFFCYGGMVAMQTLWAGPWMQRVAGYTALESATGLFWINVSMLCTFWTWGMVNPWLLRKGFGADRLMAMGLPLCSVVLLGIILGRASGRGRRLGAVLCVVHLRVVVAARRGHGVSAGARWAGAVGIQPRDFCGRVCGAVGHRAGGGRVCGRGAGHRARVPGGHGGVPGMQRRRLRVVPASGAAP